MVRVELGESRSSETNESNSQAPDVETDASSSERSDSKPKKKKYPLEGQIREEKVCKLRTAEATKSTLTEETLLPLISYHQCRKVHIFMAEPKDQIHAPLRGCTGFYSQALALGIGLPVHPFFILILGSYGIAPGQLTPFAWCHLLGTYFLWSDLGFNEPSVDIWHYLYIIQEVNEHPLFYFFTKRSNDRKHLINSFPCGMGDWRTRFFHLDGASGGPGFLEEFAEASG